MVKRKPMQRKKQEEVNKKALLWIGISVGVIVVVMAVLLIAYT